MKKLALSILSISLAGAASAVTLPNVNCAGASSDARCTLKTDVGSYGSIGAGVPLYLGGFTDQIGSGFVEPSENALYVPYEIGGQLDTFGAILKVDLATGDRTLISGRVDETEQRGKGVTYVSDRGQTTTEWGLGRVNAVRPGPDANTLYALQDYGSPVRTVVLKIDKRTGDRTIVWANKLADDAAPSSNPMSIQNQEARLGVTPQTTCDRTKPDPSTFEVYQGNLYFMAAGGVMKVVPGKSCTWISAYSAADGTSTAGSGPTPGTQVMSGTWLDGNLLSATTGPGQTWLMTTNLDTGERRLVSAFNERVPNKGPGRGQFNIGYLGTHAAGLTVYATTGYTSVRDFYMTVIDKRSGDRTLVEGKGSLKRGNTQNMRVIAAIPGTDQFVVWYERALHVVDARTGVAFILSQ
ncbi:hypothetical protein [Deinococcus soli (ex Cha et al. 2016)]|uniref:Uncharacterized protein n=2 Tax=Deinococcus soli (ex Cha et al. 2016) TaxID=1309411 RepID=A0AAE3XEQ2_9DEIO|nr:hypothetical protein [Deinococcus soli (ex Cha et al. 2016)]MDR6218353.1 hypothetical protein [Deinococcus soli (ex Cha et al. 2016)]MDR6329093.1 hypothetical protein [Deinococcus soli (ex Cha et al. 2016)]MDR6751366.1 hypothetical protein [Deinococcus soli (ex Cha et al. 2016)]